MEGPVARACHCRDTELQHRGEGGNPPTSLFWASDVLLVSQTSPGVQPPGHGEQGQEAIWRTQLSHPAVPLLSWKRQPAEKSWARLLPLGGAPRAPGLGFRLLTARTLPPTPAPSCPSFLQASAGTWFSLVCVGSKYFTKMTPFSAMSHLTGRSKASKPPYLHRSFKTLCLAYHRATVKPTSQAFHL